MINVPISPVDDLSTSLIKTFTIIDFDMAEVILKVVIIIAIMLEKIDNAYIR
jgi:hypothetical protein